MGKLDLWKGLNLAEGFGGKRCELFQCPACARWKRRSPTQKTPRSVAHFRVYIVGLDWLIFKCDKCSERFRIKYRDSR